MEISSGHNGAIRSLDIENIQSRYLLTGGLDCKICLYDLYSTQMESNEDHPRQNLGSDAKRIIPLSSSHKDENSGHSYAITSVQWYPTDNESFFSSSFDGKLNVWETELFEIAGSFQCGSKIYDCAIHPQNYHSLVACATESSGIRLCDLNSGDSSHTLGTHSSAPRCLDWCPYHEYTLVSGSVDGTVCLWDIRKAGVHAQYLSFDLLQDHSAVIDRSIHQRVDWNRQLAAKAHSKAVTAVKFTPGGRHLVSCGNDKCVRLWDAQTGKLHPIRYDPCCHSTLKYEIDIVGVSSSSSDDLLLYPGPDKTINLTPLHSSTGKALKSLHGHIENPTSIQMLSDYRLVSCGVDGLIFLWDGREKEADQAVDDWIEKRKAPPVENDSDDEFIPEILRNYMHDGPAVLR